MLRLLDGAEKRLFIYNADASEITASMALENFIGGFRLGARMAMEVIRDGYLKDVRDRSIWILKVS